MCARTEVVKEPRKYHARENLVGTHQPRISRNDVRVFRVDFIGAPRPTGDLLLTLASKERCILLSGFLWRRGWRPLYAIPRRSLPQTIERPEDNNS